MKTLHLSGQFRRVLLLAGCAVAVVYMAAAQESPQKSEDRNDYLKPGSAKGWYDFRNEVKLPASEVFTTYKWLFHLGDADEMRLHSQKADRLGFTHFKYYQYYRNYRIWGSDVIVHERNGRTESVNGNMVAGMNQQTTPMLTEDRARAIAIQSMGSVKFLWEDEEAQRLLREEKMILQQHGILRVNWFGQELTGKRHLLRKTFHCTGHSMCAYRRNTENRSGCL